MDELSWIVVHGREVWVAALLGLAAIGATLGILAVWARRSLRTRAALQQLGELQHKGLREEGARVTLAGRWAAGRVTSAFAAAAGSRAPLASASEGDLALVADGEAIAVLGKPAVLSGAREAPARAFGQLPAETREWIIAESADASLLVGAARVELRSVEHGDRVHVGGVLRRVAQAEGAKGYRQAAAAFAISVEHGADGHGIVAAPRLPVATTVRAAIVGAAAGLTVFGLLFVGGGSLAYRAGAYEVAAATPAWRDAALGAMAEQLRSAGSAHVELVRRQVALAELHGTPDRVQGALRVIAGWLHQLPHHDPRLLQEEVALAKLRGSPEEALDALIRHRHLERAARDADFDPSPGVFLGRARAFVELGEWEQASLMLEQARGDRSGTEGAVVHLLAGRPSLAARTLRRAAVDGFPLRARMPAPTQALLAVADALDARAGSAAARDHLQGRVREHPEDRAPQLLLADLVTGTERTELMVHYTRIGPPEAADMSLQRLLAREIGDGRGRNWDRLAYPVWLAFGREEGHLWELLPALFEPEAVLAQEPYARIEGAFVASALGDHDRAAALLRPAASPGSDYVDLIPVLSHVIDRRRRAEDPQPEAHVAWIAHSIGAWEAGAHDGRSLVDVLDRSPLDADHAYVVARSVTSGRDELSAWLRHGAFEHRSKTRLGRLAELENLRLCAIAVGDGEVAEELGAIVARHRRALLRREILVPLAVLEGLVLEGVVDGDL